MKLEAFKNHLQNLQTLQFQLEDGTKVPAHFHITEIGKIQKHFIDCGGTVRVESNVDFQIWYTVDTDHRLSPEKLLNIIAASEQKLQLENDEILVEYQNGKSIGLYHLDFENDTFVLKNTSTACLAEDHCGIDLQKAKVLLKDFATSSDNACCEPGSGCC